MALLFDLIKGVGEIKALRKGESVDEKDVTFYAGLSNQAYEPSLKKRRKLVEASKSKEEHKGFRRDASLSDKQQHVFVNKKTKQVVTAYRGTSKHDLTNDVMTDIALAVGSENATRRFKKAKRKFEKIIDKYDDYKHITTGHSLGGSIANSMKQHYPDFVDEVHMFNPGSGIGSINPFKKTKGVHGHYIAGDPISMLGMTAGHNTHIYKQKGSNKHTIENFI